MKIDSCKLILHLINDHNIYTGSHNESWSGIRIEIGASKDCRDADCRVYPT